MAHRQMMLLPGDMMIDGVFPRPRGGGRSVSIGRPRRRGSVWRCRGLTVRRRELATLDSLFATSACPVAAPAPGQSRATVVGARGCAVMVNASSPRSVRTCAA